MKIPKKLKKLSRADQGDLIFRIVKLGEELGEVQEAYLRMVGRKSASGKTKEQLRADVVEELVDTMIMTMDVLCGLKFTKKKKLRKLIKAKLEKWENSVKNYPEQNKTPAPVDL